jgi:nitroimidazol reductase NimA-like FMN-containing flavoprotein (pyridoxamine 5'-phosphate oxidase superfamily)
MMDKKEYDKLINNNYICRIAFNGQYPYIAPFLYVFDGKYIYFLSTKYGKKHLCLDHSPHVAVEIEDYLPDMSKYRFVTLRGKIKESGDEKEKQKVKEMFVHMIKDQKLSPNVMAALGHSPQDSPDSLLNDDRSFVWKLVDVMEIVALKNK